MEASAIKEIFALVQSKRAARTTSVQSPSPSWFTAAGVRQGGLEGFIQIPTGGTLSISYSYDVQPATTIVIFHQDFSVTPILLGDNNIPVEANDLIFWASPQDANNMIELTYQIL